MNYASVVISLQWWRGEPDWTVQVYQMTDHHRLLLSLGCLRDTLHGKSRRAHILMIASFTAQSLAVACCTAIFVWPFT